MQATSEQKLHCQEGEHITCCKSLAHTCWMVVAMKVPHVCSMPGARGAVGGPGSQLTTRTHVHLRARCLPLLPQISHIRYIPASASIIKDGGIYTAHNWVHYLGIHRTNQTQICALCLACSRQAGCCIFRHNPGCSTSPCMQQRQTGGTVSCGADQTHKYGENNDHKMHQGISCTMPDMQLQADRWTLRS
jgi:hypothetical protein